jgi:hypothetical protein
MPNGQSNGFLSSFLVAASLQGVYLHLQFQRLNAAIYLSILQLDHLQLQL